MRLKSTYKNQLLTKLSCFLLLFSPLMLLSQVQPEFIDYDVPVEVREDLRWDETPILDIMRNEAETGTVPYDFTLNLVHVSQYMQSSRLVFELTNHTESVITNFWVHVSLLDRKGLFLYREEPVFFVNLRPGQKGRTDILCESVGIEEIGYVVIYPMLLEKDRNEISFDKEKVELIQFPGLPARMAFYSAFN